MNVETARNQLEAVMKKHANYGACDSEGWQAMRQIEETVEEGKRFPFAENKPWPHDNPFQLYDSIEGWRVASQELIAAAEVYWRALVEEKLGVKLAD